LIAADGMKDETHAVRDSIWEIGATNVVEASSMGESAMVTFSHNGKRFIAACDGGVTYVCDSMTGQYMTPPLRQLENIYAVGFAPDDRSVATASWDGTARIWNAITGEAWTPPMHHDAAVLSAQFSPDGRQLVTTSMDWTARIWDASTGTSAAEPLRHQQAILWAEFSSDGRWVATASRDKTARVWDAQTGLAVTEPLEHQGVVNRTRFSPDGTLLLTASSDGTAKIWPLIRVEETAPEWFVELAEALAGQRLDERGKPIAIAAGSVEVILKIRAAQENNPGDDTFSRWARWFFADPSKRGSLTSAMAPQGPYAGK
jgi:WD40 repeat protein